MSWILHLIQSFDKGGCCNSIKWSLPIMMVTIFLAQGSINSSTTVCSFFNFCSSLCN
jgi:hypothetical protein